MEPMSLVYRTLELIENGLVATKLFTGNDKSCIPEKRDCLPQHRGSLRMYNTPQSNSSLPPRDQAMVVDVGVKIIRSEMVNAVVSLLVSLLKRKSSRVGRMGRSVQKGKAVQRLHPSSCKMPGMLVFGRCIFNRLFCRFRHRANPSTWRRDGLQISLQSSFPARLAGRPTHHDALGVIEQPARLGELPPINSVLLCLTALLKT